VTVESLLEEMVDLERLAHSASYTARQLSSYDRASRAADADGWFANGDAGNYLRVDKDGEHVLAEAEGPGAIVRIWSANPGGRLRIYLDGEVALEADFAALTRGDLAGLPAPFRRRARARREPLLPVPVLPLDEGHDIEGRPVLSRERALLPGRDGGPHVSRPANPMFGLDYLRIE
jgi:hypothetical protein